jgi:hypothetical protein
MAQQQVHNKESDEGVEQLIAKSFVVGLLFTCSPVFCVLQVVTGN